jgi:hypothetical protein
MDQFFKWWRILALASIVVVAIIAENYLFNVQKKAVVAIEPLASSWAMQSKTIPPVFSSTITTFDPIKKPSLSQNIITPTPTTTTSTSDPAPAPLSAPTSTATPNSTIDAVSIQESPNVGLLCHYKINDATLKQAYASIEDSNGEMLTKGSGVIVDPQGYILTAKHITDPQWANVAYASSVTPNDARLNEALIFDYCDVGVPPNVTAPSVALLQSINPSITLSNPFPYVATLAFEPSQGGFSDLEYNNLDFAVLKISGPMKNCQLFNKCTLPSSFPYSPVLYSFTPDQSSQPNVLIDFGYPAESINSSGGSFTDFYLKGAVGSLTTYYMGDKYFKDKPFLFKWQASDVLPGRSGSPIYWQGYVVGIDVSESTNNSTMDYAVGMPVIADILRNNGMGDVLRER